MFREGDPFEAIAAVRAGTVKTYVIDSEGREQVLGFLLPGEVIGLNAIRRRRYPCNAVALDTVMLCRFSFPNIAALATRVPGLQQQLFRLLSRGHRQGGAAGRRLSPRTSAWRRSCRALSRRYAARGFSADAVPAHDDAHRHRQLPAPGVRKPSAACFRRFQDDGLLRVDRREIEITDRGANSKRWRAAVSCASMRSGTRST